MNRSMFCSDLHLGHKAAPLFRIPDIGCMEVGDHDKFVTDSIVKSLNPKDTLYILGDIVFVKDSLKYFYQICEYLSKGHVRIVLGNHDIESNTRPSLEELTLHKNTKIIPNGFTFKDNLLTHIPVHPEQLRGKNNIHGHMHHKVIKDKRYFNVCLEQTGYRALSYTQLKYTTKYKPCRRAEL